MSTFGAWLLSSKTIYDKIDAYNVETLMGIHTEEPFAGVLEAMSLRPVEGRMRRERVKRALIQAMQEHQGPANGTTSWVNL